jgi:hypothetical protein
LAAFLAGFFATFLATFFLANVRPPNKRLGECHTVIQAGADVRQTSHQELFMILLICKIFASTIFAEEEKKHASRAHISAMIAINSHARSALARTLCGSQQCSSSQGNHVARYGLFTRDAAQLLCCEDQQRSAVNRAELRQRSCTRARRGALARVT